jgi:hypothetical protein
MIVPSGSIFSKATVGWECVANAVEHYQSLAKYFTTWDYHLWGRYPRSLCAFQVFLPPNSDTSGTIFSKATVVSSILGIRPHCEQWVVASLKTKRLQLCQHFSACVSHTLLSALAVQSMAHTDAEQEHHSMLSNMSCISQRLA